MMQSQAILPTEVFGCVLSFCDGKTISTFLSAAVTSNDHRPKIPIMIATIMNQRLLAFVDCLSGTPTYMPRLMSPFVSEYASSIQQDCPASWTHAVNFLSSRLAVLDYFEDALKHREQRDGAYEWLVWCGKIRLIHSMQESRSIAHYSELDLVESDVQVMVTSPCWYPGLAHKWSRGMQQCNVYASDFCRRYNQGGQHNPNPPTHVARVTPNGSFYAEYIDQFNKQKRSGDFANPLDSDLLPQLILDRLFLVSPRDADRITSRMSWAAGSMKTSLHSARTCPSDSLFCFWTDMMPTDRMRSMTEFTADILELQRNRDRLSRIYA